MRPYQIVAAEKILQRIVTATNHKQLGTVAVDFHAKLTQGFQPKLTHPRFA
jgi:type I restriction enzyme R subunit